MSAPMEPVITSRRVAARSHAALCTAAASSARSIVLLLFLQKQNLPLLLPQHVDSTVVFHIHSPLQHSCNVPDIARALFVFAPRCHFKGMPVTQMVRKIRSPVMTGCAVESTCWGKSREPQRCPGCRRRPHHRTWVNQGQTPQTRTRAHLLTDPTTCPSHPMSQRPCTGSHTTACGLPGGGGRPKRLHPPQRDSRGPGRPAQPRAAHLFLPRALDALG